MQEDQKPTMPTGEVENKKKATKLPLKAKVTKRQFSVVYELRDVQSCPQCAFKPLNPTNRDIPAHPTFSPDAA